MSLHLLDGTQRLLIENPHQHSKIVILACSTEVQYLYAICVEGILTQKNIFEFYSTLFY